MRKYFATARVTIYDEDFEIVKQFYYEDTIEGLSGWAAIDDLVEQIYEEYGEEVDIDDEKFREVAR